MLPLLLSNIMSLVNSKYGNFINFFDILKTNEKINDKMIWEIINFHFTDKALLSVVILNDQENELLLITDFKSIIIQINENIPIPISSILLWNRTGKFSYNSSKSFCTVLYTI